MHFVSFSLELRVRAWLTTISWFMWFQRENYLFLGFDQHCTKYTALPQNGTEISGLINHRLELRTTTISWIYAVSHTEGLLTHHVSLCLVQFHCFVENTELSFVVLTRSLRLDFHCVLSWSFLTEYLSYLAWSTTEWNLDQPKFLGSLQFYTTRPWPPLRRHSLDGIVGLGRVHLGE